MIDYDIIKAHSDPEFVARTYGEYLQHRANEYTELIDTVSNAVSINADTVLDAVDASFETDMLNLNDLLVTAASDLGYDLNNMSSADPDYQTAIELAIQYNDVQEFLTQNFDDPSYITIHAKEFFVPDYSIESTVSIPEYSSLENVSIEPLKSHYKAAKSAISDYADALCSSSDYDINMPITLNAGYTTIKDLLYSVAMNSYTAIEDSTSLNLTLKNVNGALITTPGVLANYSYSGLVDEMKSTLASCVTMAGGFIAAAKDTVADRIATFTSYVGGKFKDITNYASTLVSSVTETLSNAKTTTQDFFNSYLEMCGWREDVNHDPIVEDSVNDTDMSKYTGVCHIGALDFSNAIKLGTTVIKTIATTAAGVAMAAFNLGKKLFTKVGAWFVRNVIEGSDLQDLGNGSKNSVVDGFQFQGESLNGYTSESTPGNIHLNTSLMNINYILKLHDKLSSLKGQWISFSTLYGFCLLRINFVSLPVGECNINYSFVFKPYCINPEKIVSAVKLKAAELNDNNAYYDGSNFYLRGLSMQPATWKAFGNFLQSDNDLLVDATQLDKYRVRGYALGAELECMLAKAAAAHVNTQVQASADIYSKLPLYSISSDYQYSSDLYYHNDYSHYGSTNLDIIKACSGYDANLTVNKRWYTVQSAMIGRSYSNASGETRAFDVNGLIYCYVIAMLEQDYWPLDYGYLAYSNNETTLPTPQFRIMTDAENEAVINNAIVTAIIVVVVAAVALKTVLWLKARQRKKFMKWTSTVGAMDNAMWNNKALTPQETRKYIRYRRKLEKSNFITKGLTGTSEDSSLIDKIKAVASQTNAIYNNLSNDKPQDSDYSLPSTEKSKNTTDERIGTIIDLIK